MQQLEHIQLSRFHYYIVGGIRGLAGDGNLAVRLNGLYWIMLPLLTVPLGIWTRRPWYRAERAITARMTGLQGAVRGPPSGALGVPGRITPVTSPVTKGGQR